MSLMSIERYNMLKNAATKQLDNQYGIKTDEKKPNLNKYIDAYANAYAQNQNLGQNVFDYSNASDKELQNWALAKEMRKNTGYTLFKGKNF